MDPLEQLDQLGPVLAGVVTQIDPSQLDRPTPCTKFTVRGVLEHMIGGATSFASAFRGKSPPAADGNQRSDPLGRFGEAMTGLADGMHSPGALDRTIVAPFGDVPGEAFARFVVLDGLVHGWDLATATGAGLGCGKGNAGVYFCNHVRFRWKRGGSWFVATLHSFGNSETTVLLGRLIRQLRPISTLPHS